MQWPFICPSTCFRRCCQSAKQGKARNWKDAVADCSAPGTPNLSSAP